MTKGHVPGGGIESRVVTERPVRTGSGSRSTRPAGVAQFGQIQGDHVTNRDSTGYRGERLHNDRNFQPVKFGNELATNVGKGGPGTGRDVHATGSQGVHGSAAPGNPQPQQGDILNQYGPNIRR